MRFENSSQRNYDFWNGHLIKKRKGNYLSKLIYLKVKIGMGSIRLQNSCTLQRTLTLRDKHIMFNTLLSPRRCIAPFSYFMLNSDKVWGCKSIPLNWEKIQQLICVVNGNEVGNTCIRGCLERDKDRELRNASILLSACDSMPASMHTHLASCSLSYLSD